MTNEQFQALTKLSTNVNDVGPRIDTDEVCVAEIPNGAVVVEANDHYDDERGKVNSQTWLILPDGKVVDCGRQEPTTEIRPFLNKPVEKTSGFVGWIEPDPDCPQCAKALRLAEARA